MVTAIKRIKEEGKTWWGLKVYETEVGWCGRNSEHRGEKFSDFGMTKKSMHLIFSFSCTVCSWTKLCVSLYNMAIRY